MRIATPKLAKSMARQVRFCASGIADAPSAIRNEMLSIASTLRYLSAELEYGADCAKACEAAAQRLQAQLRSEGLDLPTDVPQILKAIASPDVPGSRADAVFAGLVEYLYACNQAELAMYRQGLQRTEAKG